MIRKYMPLVREFCSNSRPSRQGGFTLIELLVVVAIVLVLMGMLIVTIPKVRQRQQITHARHDINQLEVAFSGFFTEYKRWPVGLTGYDTVNAENTATGIQVEPGVVRMLRGENINSMNPRQIPFYEARTQDVEGGALVDPWGNPYKYMMDFNQDDVLHVKFTDLDWNTNFFKKGVAIWSRGRDGSDKISNGGHEDDVTSW